MPRTEHVWQPDDEWLPLPGGMLEVQNPLGAGTVLASSETILQWSVEDQETAGVYAVEIPDPPPGQEQVGDVTYTTDEDGRPEAVIEHQASYPDLTSVQFAEFFEASGIAVPWMATENADGSPRQLLQTERTSPPFDIVSVLHIRSYLESVTTGVPSEEDLRAAWSTAYLPKPPVDGDAPYDPTKLYVLDDTCTDDGHIWRWRLPYSIPGWEPGPETWAAWQDMGSTSGGIQPWTQRTAGNFMYGVDIPGPHPEGSAAIGTLVVSFQSANYKLIGPDNWGFDPPTSIGASLPVWQVSA